ncbi:MAG: rod shape-determining protein MreD [Nitrospira sp.]|nr:rod shape-determining protein MreD [Nitrospira sp.]
MKPILSIIGIIGIILLQTTLLNSIAIMGIKPDLALIAVYFVGLFGDEIRGVMTGLALGYLMDLMSGGVWGIHLATKPTLGFLAGLLGRTLVNMKVVFTGVIISLCSVVQGLIFLLVSYFTMVPENPVALLSYTILPQAIYDGVVGSGLFWFLSGRFTPRQSTAHGWLKSPALSALGSGGHSPSQMERTE